MIDLPGFSPDGDAHTHSIVAPYAALEVAYALKLASSLASSPAPCRAFPETGEAGCLTARRDSVP